MLIYKSVFVTFCTPLKIKLEKTMAPHSSTLAWKIPWTEEPCRLQSMWSLRVGHNWATSLSLFTFMHWRRKWQPTPVFLPGESQGQGEPGGLPSLGLHRVGHDWSDLAAAAAVNSQLGNDQNPQFPKMVVPYLHQQWKSFSSCSSTYLPTVSMENPFNFSYSSGCV